MTLLDQLPTPMHLETTTSEDDRASVLRAEFIADERPAYLGLLTGARCELPTGEAVEVHHRRTPFFSLCRELDALGYGNRRIGIFTPQGTPSMRAVVRVAAGLAVKERDRGGLRLERFQKFPGPPTDARDAPRGTPDTGQRRDASQ
jgi:hypothetical protein